MEGDRITYADRSAEAPETPDAETIEAAAVMPGMWDAHTHLMGLARGVVNLEALHTQSPQIGAVRAAQDASAAIDAGVTSRSEERRVGRECRRRRSPSEQNPHSAW